MHRPFRDYHLLSLLEEYDHCQLPLDFVIHKYFKSHKALGAKDRGYIAETCYGMIRWKGLLDHLHPRQPNWAARLDLYHELDPVEYLSKEEVPSHIKVSFPLELYQLLEQSYGTDTAQTLCLSSNHQAPTTVRANPIKTGRDSLIRLWRSQGIDVEPCSIAKQGIFFPKRVNFFSMPEFKQGMFEVQDEGSQLVADLVQPMPGDHVLDYCAGSGGKTLAFAPFTEGKGQIYLHDVRPFALREAKTRLKRAGVQNVQIVPADDSRLQSLKKKMDWVLVDAPCSGTGTLWRNPDMKWRFNYEMLKRLVSQQRVIFEKALSFLRPGGKIVYATCSILPQENQQQAEHFLRTYGLRMISPPFASFPKKNEMDGFYGVVLSR